MNRTPATFDEAVLAAELEAEGSAVHNIEVVSKRERGFRPEAWDIYCGRPGPYGNPFVLKNEHDDAERNKVCDLFEAWLAEHDGVMDELRAEVAKKQAQFGKVRLVCWCTPRRCHVASYVKRLVEKEA